MRNIPIMPEQASEHAPRYDALFFTITGLAIFFTIVVAVLVIYLGKKYRKGTNVDRRNPVHHDSRMEAVMLGVPLLIGLGIFAWSAYNFIAIRTPQPHAKEIYVIGKQWMWHIQHPNGIRENNELHIPIDTPIRLTMISQDVIHSMYIPAFRAQFHVVPGRYTQLHFTATREGRYKMLCALHCGTQHSEMIGWVYVLSKEEYAQWLESGGEDYKDDVKTMSAAGEVLFREQGCYTCHGVIDTARAPTVNGIFGQNISLADGTTAIADEDYLREALVNPSARITAGYDNIMPSYQGRLSEEQILQLTEYIKSLGSADAAQEQPYGKLSNETQESGPRVGTTSSTAGEESLAGLSQANTREASR